MPVEMKEGCLILEPRDEEGLREEFEKKEDHEWLFLCTEGIGKDLYQFLNWWGNQDGKVVMMGNKTTKALLSSKITKLIILTNMDGERVGFEWVETLREGKEKLIFAICYAGMEFEEAKFLLNERTGESGRKNG